MDLEKLINFVVKYVSAYVQTFARTLVRPSSIFAPIPLTPVLSGATPTHSVHTSQINPELLSFAVISILIGLQLRLIAPRGSAPSLLPAAIGLLAVWIVFAVCFHIVARLFGGAGSFWATATITLQIFGVMYVLSNLMALAGRLLTAFAGMQDDTSGAEAGAYLIMQAAFLSFYMPKGIAAVHRIKGWQLLVAVLAVWAIVLMFVIASAVSLKTVHKEGHFSALRMESSPTLQDASNKQRLRFQEITHNR